MSKPTTSKYSIKQYKCAYCGTTQMIGTNHYGEVYSRCSNFKCSSRLPPANACYTPPRHSCHEAVPEDMGTPEPWTVVKLGDIAEIVGAQS